MKLFKFLRYIILQYTKCDFWKEDIIVVGLLDRQGVKILLRWQTEVYKSQGATMNAAWISVANM